VQEKNRVNLEKTTNESERELSIVIPVYNEEKNLALLHTQLKSILETLTGRCEVIFVDDGSNDDSFSILEKLHRQDSNVKVIQFRKNFGKAAALSAGFAQARGRIIITMDADLQDDPREIPNFIQKLDEGYDLVSGWRSKRRDSLSKTLASRLFNRLTSTLTRVRIHDFNCGFKAYRKELVKEIDLYGELHRYIPVLAYWRGYRIGEIKVKHRPRTHGESKYGTGRLFRGLTDLLTVMFLTKYMKRPLHVFAAAGIVLLLLGFLINVYLAVLWFLGQGIGDRPLLLLGILLILIGFQTISTGLIGEIIVGSRHREGSGYVVKKILE